MDKSSLIGLVVGIALILTAIFLGGSLIMFINIPGVLIVLGGTAAATAVAFPTTELKNVMAVTRRVFNDPGNEMKQIMEHLIESRKVMKKEGMLALERMAEAAPTPMLRRGLLLLADGADANAIRQILQTEQRTVEDHHKTGQKMFSEMGKYAPAFGMVGTLIGLVQMLANLSDPSSIGPAMAVALLTTFYGAVASNLVFLPMVTKLSRRIEVEATQTRLIMIGLDSVQRGESGTILQEKMEVMFSTKKLPADEEAGKEAA